MCGRERRQRTSRDIKVFTKENEDFQEKILSRSGLGNKTYFPLCTWAQTAPPANVVAPGGGGEAR